MKKFALIVPVVVLLAAAPAMAQVTTLVENGDPSRRIDVVIRSESVPLETLNTLADVLVSIWQSHSPLSDYFPYFNFHRIDEIGGSAALAPDVDLVINIVGSGCNAAVNGTIINLATTCVTPRVVMHEYGHNNGLRHEVGGGTGNNDPYPYAEPHYPNVTTGLTKWLEWVEEGTPIPTPVDHEFDPDLPVEEHIGFIPGAFGYNVGIYRPSNWCTMGNGGPDNPPLPGYDAVCRQQVVRNIYTKYPDTALADSMSPEPGVIGSSGPVALSVVPMQPADHDLELEWYVNGNLAQSGGTTFTFEPSGGPAVVVLSIRDATPMVRADPLPNYGQMNDSYAWIIGPDDSAPVILVPEQIGTVQQAIQAAPNGTVIDIAQGVYVENLVVPAGKTVTLRGRDGAQNTVLDGGGVGPVVMARNIGALTLEDLTIKNGLAIANPDGFGTFKGGVYVKFADSLTVRRCRIRDIGNGLDTPLPPFWLAAFYSDAADQVTIQNVLITGSVGNGVLLYGADSADIVSCTIAENTWGGIRIGSGTTASLRNLIIVSNGQYGVMNEGYNSSVVITYSAVVHNGNEFDEVEPGEGMLTGDPLLQADYHLSPESPCIDAGDPADPYFNEPIPNGGRINMGAFGNTPEAAPTPNVPPVADAGENRTVHPGEVVTLDGSASHDPDDGPIALGHFWYSSDPRIELFGKDQAVAKFVAPAAPGSFVFRLRVWDGEDEDWAAVTITVLP